MTRNLGRLHIAAFCALFALLAASCGDDDDGQTARTTDATESESTGSSDASEPVKLRLVNTGQYDLTAIGPDAGDYLGTFEDAGIELDVLYGQEVVETLASGDVDLGITSPNRLVGAIQQGLEATILGPTVDGWVQYILVRPETGVTSVEEFKGGKIGISRVGSAGHFSALKVAEELEWSDSDYELVALGGLDALVAALDSGTIDSFMWSAEAAFSLEAEGTGVIIGNVAELVTDMPLNVLVVSNATLDDRPEDVRRFCEAFYDAQATFKGDQDVAQEAFESWGVESEVATRMIETSSEFVSSDPSLNDEALANIADATNVTIEESDVSAEDVAAAYKSCSDI